MPEEHNRRIIDHISEHLFATGIKAQEQLLKESVQGTIYVVGNPIVTRHDFTLRSPNENQT